VSEPRSSLLQYVDSVWRLARVGLPAVYVVGYLVWSFHAWQNGLGPLPAFTVNYLTAGIPPAVVTFITVMAYSWNKHLSSWLLASHRRGDKEQLRYFKILMYGVFGLLAVLMVWHQSIQVRDLKYEAMWLRSSLGIVTSILLILGFYLETAWAYAKWKHRYRVSKVPWAGITMTFIFVVWFLLALFFTSFFVTQIYPIIPQEFGGVQPKRAILHVRLDAMSDNMKDQLLEPQARGTQGSLVDTREVLVFFATDNRLIVKPSPVPYDTRGGTLDLSQASADRPTLVILNAALVGITYLPPFASRH
jgi:hypothetical protein